MNAIASHYADETCKAVTFVADIDALRAADTAEGRMWRHYQATSCRECGQMVYATPVRGKGGKRECGAWCWDGSGTSCTCQCAGRNHGSSYAHIGATGAA